MWFILCLVLGGSPAQPPVVVGFWNIEKLGAREPSQSPERLARYIDSSGLDLLCVCEIYDNTQDLVHPGERRRGNRTLDSVVQYLSGGNHIFWRYQLLPNRNPNDTSQLCGFLWNTRVLTLVGGPRPLQCSDREKLLWDREPHGIKFSSGEGMTDFVVIPIHMKSSYGDLEAGIRTREQEAEVLAHKLEWVSRVFEDHDIVILGDTNVSPGERALQVELSREGFRDLNQSNTPTFVKSNWALDRIFVPQHQTEFHESTQLILRPADDGLFRRTLSDHYLVTTQIQQEQDDD